MTELLAVLLALPVAAGLLGMALPAGLGRLLQGVVALAAVVIAVILAFEVDPLVRGGGVEILEPWLPSLGMTFHVAVDGLNAVLVVLTTFVFAIGTWWSLRDPELASPSYLLLLGIAHSAVLLAFVAQDLIIFVLAFDLMLLPFVVIAARAAEPGQGLAAVTMLLVYTALGSLLMFVGAIGLGILTAQANGGPISFDFSVLGSAALPPSTQRWILLSFLAAFLIKMPIVPFHGWMPGAYRAIPLPALAIFAAILSKVAAYGFLRIVLPMLPDAVVDLRLLLVVLALASILWGSLAAFATPEPRLVLGYSSIAQLGFILLGISSLDPAGAQGAIFQSVTHALVVVPAIILIAVVAERSGGATRLDQLGGLARRAPVLAAVFLVVALAWLAMPGSGNFVAEYLVLLGQWRVSPWAAIVGSIGVVLAAAYALRFMIGVLQNARGAAVPDEAPEMGRADASLLGLSVGALVLVALVPQLALEPSRTAAQAAVEPPRILLESRRSDGEPGPVPAGFELSGGRTIR